MLAAFKNGEVSPGFRQKKSFAEAKDSIWQGRRDSNSRHPVLETVLYQLSYAPKVFCH